MKTTKLLIIPAIIVAVLSTGCATGQYTGNAYTGTQARQAQIVKTGKVSYVKDVSIQAANSGIGGAAGASVGAIAASNVGKGRGALAAVIAGAVVGGVAGHLADNAVNRLNGQEITVLLRDGTEVAIAQETDPATGKFNVGDNVRLLTSPFGTTRVSK